MLGTALLAALLCVAQGVLAAADVTITSGNAVRGPWYGFGVNWQTYSYTSSKPSSADWSNTYVPRLQFMKPGVIRLMMSVQYAGYPGSPNWSSSAMNQIYRVLDYAQANSIPVMLAEWGNGWAQPSGWLLGDANYTDAIGKYMQHLTQVKGYTCIKWFVLGNEPNYDNPADGQINFPNGISQWAGAVSATKDKFNSLGLSGFSIVGPDASESAFSSPWTTTTASSYSSLVSGYDLHLYASVSDILGGGIESGLDTIFDSVVNSDPAQTGKVFVDGEAGIRDGMSTTSNAYIATHDYGLWMADYGVQAARAQLGAIAAWSIDNDGVSQNWGLWDSKANGYTLRPWYYIWSLLSRYAPAGSTVYAPANPSSSVRVLAIRNTSGRWTFVGVNEGAASADINFIHAPDTSQQTFSRYLYSQASSPTDSSGFPTPISTMQAAPSGGVSMSIPASSAVVLTSMDFGELTPRTPAAPSGLRVF